MEVEMCKRYPDNHILLMVSRTEHANSLYEMLNNEDENVDILSGNKDEYDSECRILIVTDKKGGVGFNWEKVDMLILGFDCTDVRQFEGRVRATEFVIIDFVHEFTTFDKHFEQNRKPWYLERGATMNRYPIFLNLSRDGTFCVFHMKYTKLKAVMII